MILDRLEFILTLENKIMPRLAFVKIDARCPYCSYLIDDMISMQWGYCPASQPLEGCVYQIGDQIRWKINRDGSVSSWSFFADGEANIGNPEYDNLIVTDVAHWSWGTCGNCSLPIGGGAVEIREHRISKSWLFSITDFDQEIDVFAITTDGSILEKPVWAKHKMLTFLK